MGAFALVTAEFLPVGLLPDVAADLGVSPGQAVLTVTMSDFVAALAAPLTIAFAGPVGRRHLLTALLALLVASPLIAASATGLAQVLSGRALLGAAVGGFRTVAGSLGPRLRPGAEGIRGSAVILSGISLGIMAGVPAGSLLGGGFGWRVAFVATAALAISATLAPLLQLPRLHFREDSPFCPDLTATPDGEQVWFTLRDVGRTQVFAAKPPFEVLATIETGPITSHVNIVRTGAGQFAYVTVGGFDLVKVFRTDDFSQVATIPTGTLPHELRPCGDGSQIYVGLENADKVAVIVMAANEVMTENSIGQGPQSVAYVPDAAPEGPGTANLQPLGRGAETVALELAGTDGRVATQVTLSAQGPLQILQTAVTGLSSNQPHVLALSDNRDGTTSPESLVTFVTNPAGAAIVNAVGPIRQIVRTDDSAPRRYLVVLQGKLGDALTSVQTPPERATRDAR